MRQSILITGAASGIGRETAIYFAEKGWFVGLFDINMSGLENLADQIGQDRCFVHAASSSCGVDMESHPKKKNPLVNSIEIIADTLQSGTFFKASYYETLYATKPELVSAVPESDKIGFDE